MNTAYIILGMKRSGHHAIVYWIGSNLNDAVHYNDCNKGWRHGELFPNPNQGNKGKIIKFNKCNKSNNHIFNIEDFDMDNIKKYDMFNLKMFKRYKIVYFILVLRDPYNWIASCKKMGGNPWKNIDKRIILWKKQANLFINKNENIICINFNKWFSDEEYRKKLSLIFNLKSYNKYINITSPRGGGSSFDGMRFNKRANEMKILERYKSYLKEPEYINKFDYDLIKLGNKIFPKIKIGLK